MRRLIALLLLAAGPALADSTITITPPAVTIDPPAFRYQAAPYRVTVPTVAGPKGDKGDGVDLAPLTARMAAVEAALVTLTARIQTIDALIAALQAGGGTTTPPTTGGGTTTPPVVTGPPVTPATCTVAAVEAASSVNVRGGDPANPATWPKVELTVGAGGVCPTLPEAMSVVLAIGYQDGGPGHPLDLTLTLNPSQEYVDATSSDWLGQHGGAATWPRFEQIIAAGKVLIRPTPGAGQMLTFRSQPASLSYGKGVLILDPRFDGADITIEDTRIVGTRRGDVDGNMTSIWLEVNDKRSTITLRRVVLQDADTCILNGGPNMTVILDTVWTHGCGNAGRTHNIYIGRVARFEATNVLSTDVLEGHLMKVRANRSVLRNVRLLDGTALTLTTNLFDGVAKAFRQSSYALDFPNGGDVDIDGLWTRKGPLASNAFHIAYGEEADANGGQWPEKSLRIKNWIAASIANEANDYAKPAYIAGIWNATAAPITIDGVSQFGIDPARFVVTGPYGNSTPGPLPGVTVLPSMPTFDATPPVQ